MFDRHTPRRLNSFRLRNQRKQHHTSCVFAVRYKSATPANIFREKAMNIKWIDGEKIVPPLMSDWTSGTTIRTSASSIINGFGFLSSTSIVFSTILSIAKKSLPQTTMAKDYGMGQTTRNQCNHHQSSPPNEGKKINKDEQQNDLNDEELSWWSLKLTVEETN